MQRSVVTISAKVSEESRTHVLETGEKPAVPEERLEWPQFDRRVKYVQTTKRNGRFHSTHTKVHCLLEAAFEF